MKKILVTIILILILSVTALNPVSCSSVPKVPDDNGGNSNTEDLAPDFELMDINDDTVTLQGLRGKPVMVVFWMIQCPACVMEMPYLQAVYEEWTERDLVLLTINVRDSASQIKEFLIDEDLSLPVLLDSNLDVAKDYGVRYTPTTFYIDKSGILKSTKIGAYNNATEIERDINQFIS